jgi:hypothetical protein
VEHRAGPRLDVDLAVARHPLEIEVVILGDLAILFSVLAVVATFSLLAVIARGGLAMLASGQACEDRDDTTTTSEPSIIYSHG